MSRDDGDRLVIGLHPVRELLRAERPLRRIMLDVNRSASPVVDEIVAAAAAAGIPLQEVPRDRIDGEAEGLVHQGVLAVAPAFPYVDVDRLVDRAERRGEPALLVLLDGITDPHNLGAIARTAEVVGAHGLIIPRRRAASVTPVAEKSAAGALAHLAVARVANIASTVRTLGQRGIWAVGLDGRAATSLFACELLTEPLVLVVGSEGAGLARSSYVHCDLLVKLPMHGHLESLNASVAAGVGLYEIRRRRDVGKVE